MVYIPLHFKNDAKKSFYLIIRTCKIPLSYEQLTNAVLMQFIEYKFISTTPTPLKIELGANTWTV